MELESVALTQHLIVQEYDWRRYAGNDDDDDGEEEEEEEDMVDLQLSLQTRLAHGLIPAVGSEEEEVGRSEPGATATLGSTVSDVGVGG